ncbi:isopenicillin N synthase family dioxygenase [Falsiroseomonas tokyonensis]|uniref:2-oxoglutarate-dependent ethylene/succinate-forming enzyme n=1 Tax=Falsiroseomonas tokyonensis TaxID=430521 RepID=A0ABV7BSQ5_9PROT|nr:2-oxoglutarate and iron-dependent oxygenase domain-containing protein [Falsiroseomonas tokyonensis]MBU8537476.1 isopenicillin N synthase family oxygenase [Falsiroseomonas tokyonensis]
MPDSLPIIDVAGLRAADPAARHAVATELGAACRGAGFFLVTGHGIPEAVTQGLFGAARALFALPDAAKQAVSIRRSPHNRGYVGLSEEQLDPTKPADRKEAFNVGLDLAADDPEVLAQKPFRGVNLWPEGAPELRSAILAHFDAAWALGRLLHRGFALDLGIEEDFFEDKLDRPLATLRLLHYPAGGGTDAALGAGEHTDYGNVTVLATDGVAGLEVKRRAGGWEEVPQVPGAFVCNIGDCLMRWTNDVYVSTPHRVRAPAAERYSAAFFLDPNPETVVAVLPGCTGTGNPARYPPVTGADYLRQKLDATYAHRRAPAG